LFYFLLLLIISCDIALHVVNMCYTLESERWRQEDKNHESWRRASRERW